MSGYLNNPPRTILIESDNRPGSYPTLTSPVDAARSSEFNKPFRDTITMETPVVYGRSNVNFSDVPSSSDYIEIDNANGVTNKFVFSNAPSTFVISSNTYSVDMRGVRSSVGNSELGLNARQVSINNAARKFITAVNLATGSFITASPGKRTSEVILTQNIPGAAGNTSNTSSTVKVTISDFTGGNDTYVRYPYGVHVSDGNASMSEVVRRVISTSRSGTLDVPTSGDARLVEGYSEQHGFGSFSPFDESNSHQAFGVSTGGSELYGTQTKIYDEFFTRGSVSGSLDEPLNVKDKIVIDLTPVESTTIKSRNTTDDNYHMMYFNHVTKKWEKLGFGNYYLKNSPTLQEYLDRGYIGFGQFYNNVASVLSDASYKYDIYNPEQKQEYNRLIGEGLGSSYRIFGETSFGSSVDTFGFPFHPKYHATSSQIFPSESLIDRPFLIEKIVYEFSGSSEKGSLPGASFPIYTGLNRAYNAPTGIFFILNQRTANPDPGQENSYTNVYIANRTGGFNLANTYLPPYLDDSRSSSPPRSKIERYENGGIPQNRVLSSGGPSVYVNTVRDLVTFARIGCVWPTYEQEVVKNLLPGTTHPASVLDLAINVPASGTFNGYYSISANIKAPTYNPSLNLHIINTGSTVGPSNVISLYSARDTSTRNSLNVPTGRSYRSEFNSSKIDSSLTFAGGGTNIYTFNVSSDFSNSPYLLMPGDKLIFGWQAQISNRTAEATTLSYEGYPLTIGPGKGKLILYGSYLRDDKPVHNIYKDQLNSDAAHEAIPSGPSVLDRFETDPQMMFSGSMREEHITGTMLTRNSDGSLSVTYVNDFNIGGVRAVSARVSDGNVRQRWSFFRNTRLVDSEEQYYDSMQPDPLKVLTLNSSIGERFNTGPHIGIMIPGTSYRDDGSYDTFINSSFNKKWIGSFPFEEQYEGINRLKSIDRNALSRSKITSFNGTPGLEEEIVGIVFATGSVSPDAKPVSNLLAPGGLTEYGLNTTKTHIFPNISIDDTEPLNSTSYLDDNIANPAQERRNLQNFPTMYQFSRFMGCFGAGYLQIVQFKELQETDIDNLYLRGMLYRGVKHGLINPIPLFSNAVFNGTTYGQFRDMMEQRQYTRFSLGNNTLTESAVEVAFINRSAVPGTLNITSGSATNSSNISKNATSEHPYDDALSDYDQIWDRNTALPESLISL